MVSNLLLKLFTDSLALKSVGPGGCFSSVEPFGQRSPSHLWWTCTVRFSVWSSSNSPESRPTSTAKYNRSIAHLTKRQTRGSDARAARVRSSKRACGSISPSSCARPEYIWYMALARARLTLCKRVGRRVPCMVDLRCVAGQRGSDARASDPGQRVWTIKANCFWFFSHLSYLILFYYFIAFTQALPALKTVWKIIKKYNSHARVWIVFFLGLFLLCAHAQSNACRCNALVACDTEDIIANATVWVQVLSALCSEVPHQSTLICYCWAGQV